MTPSVHAGQHVAAGDRIGVLEDGQGHCGMRDCLHWGLLRGDSYLNPLALLGMGPSRLLPVWGVPAPYDVPESDGVPDPPARDASGDPPDHNRSPGAALVSSTTIVGGTAGVVFGLLAAAGLLSRRRRPSPLPSGATDLAGERRRRRTRR